jgi:rubredoxin
MQTQSITINFKGGIVSPGYLKEILLIAQQTRVTEVRFGLRQQLIMDVPVKYFDVFSQLCESKKIIVYKSKEAAPNIVSSYPAAGIFTYDTWLREGVYKDIFDLFNYAPRLKINICDSEQCFVPFFTGHINWVSSSSEHFWNLYIRFPKTNKLYKWKECVYTNDLALLSKRIEQEILQDKFLFYGNKNADGNLLFQRVKSFTAYINKAAIDQPISNDFSLPYYEGFNKRDNHLWLGIYRRDELFPVNFLLDVCAICLKTRIGQLYSTPWKSIIIKGIDASSRKLWDRVLGAYRINVRHAANELNWQVEDLTEEGLQLKRQIIRHFDKEDVRTYGLCFAVQTKPATTMFGSVIIQKQQTKNPHRLKSLERFDIFYKRRFNPNDKESIAYRVGVEKEHLGIYLVSLCKFFYEQDEMKQILYENTGSEIAIEETHKRMVYQCKNCFSVYDPQVGDENQGIQKGTLFEQVPVNYHCPLCESGKEDFVEVDEADLSAQIITSK